MAAKDAKQAKKALGRRAKKAQDAAAPRTAAGGPVWKVLSIGSTIVATKIATNVAQRGWKVATGRTVPVKGDFERERTRDVILFTAISSMLVATARVAVERGTASYYRNSTGHLPKKLEEEKLSPTDKKAHAKVAKAKRKSERSLKKAIDKVTP